MKKVTMGLNVILENIPNKNGINLSENNIYNSLSKYICEWNFNLDHKVNVIEKEINMNIDNESGTYLYKELIFKFSILIADEPEWNDNKLSLNNVPYELYTYLCAWELNEYGTLDITYEEVEDVVEFA